MHPPGVFLIYLFYMKYFLSKPSVIRDNLFNYVMFALLVSLVALVLNLSVAVHELRFSMVDDSTADELVESTVAEESEILLGDLLLEQGVNPLHLFNSESCSSEGCLFDAVQIKMAGPRFDAGWGPIGVEKVQGYVQEEQVEVWDETEACHMLHVGDDSHAVSLDALSIEAVSKLEGSSEDALLTMYVLRRSWGEPGGTHPCKFQDEILGVK